MTSAVKMKTFINPYPKFELKNSSRRQKKPPSCPKYFYHNILKLERNWKKRYWNRTNRTVLQYYCLKTRQQAIGVPGKQGPNNVHRQQELYTVQKQHIDQAFSPKGKLCLHKIFCRNPMEPWGGEWGGSQFPKRKMHEPLKYRLGSAHNLNCLSGLQLTPFFSLLSAQKGFLSSSNQGSRLQKCRSS